MDDFKTDLSKIHSEVNKLQSEFDFMKDKGLNSAESN